MSNITKTWLNSTLCLEKKLYLPPLKKQQLIEYAKCSENVQLWRYVKILRYCGYYSSNSSKSFLFGLLSLIYKRKLNILGTKLGLRIGYCSFDSGLQIYHSGNIVVNGKAKIGKNCRLHGSNCIGNSHNNDDCPVIGDNVRFGVGAKAFGNIYIADNVTIAAGAVVTKSCYQKGAVLAGIPAKVIKVNTF